MTLDPLISAGRTIPAHAMLAIFAVVAGAVQFLCPKGTRAHRVIGYLWVGAMFIVAVTSFFINEFRWVGPFGPIHLLSCLVLVTLWRGVHFARTNRIRAHKMTMGQLYCFGLLLAGAFTFLPGRIMHDVLFG